MNLERNAELLIGKRAGDVLPRGITSWSGMPIEEASHIFFFILRPASLWQGIYPCLQKLAQEGLSLACDGEKIVGSQNVFNPNAFFLHKNERSGPGIYDLKVPAYLRVISAPNAQKEAMAVVEDLANYFIHELVTQLTSLRWFNEIASQKLMVARAGGVDLEEELKLLSSLRKSYRREGEKSWESQVAEEKALKEKAGLMYKEMKNCYGLPSEHKIELRSLRRRAHKQWEWLKKSLEMCHQYEPQICASIMDRYTDDFWLRMAREYRYDTDSLRKCPK